MNIPKHINLSTIKKAYLVGIGGIGMSALAQYLQYRGIEVLGSDISESELTRELSKQNGISIVIGNEARIQEDIDILIYSPAILESDPQRKQAFEQGLVQYSYPQILGLISQEHPTIAISGTNGKTTTTTMLAELLHELGIHPHVIVGAISQKYQSNFIPGDSQYFLMEACEYRDSFLSIYPDILVITNITEDHLDYFKDLADIQESFVSLVNNIKTEGSLICNTDLKELEPIVKQAKDKGLKIIPYQKHLTKNIVLKLPGKHNQQNAAASLGVIEALGLDNGEARKYLADGFMGAKRRLEYIGTTEHGALIYDDYAHNPEGLQYLISGLKDYYPKKKITLIFEPHLYSRTRDFKEAFARSLELADELYLFPTYRAREAHNPKEDFLLGEYINTQKLELNLVKEEADFSEIFSKEKYGKNHIIVTAGAGVVWKQGLKIKKS